ncbi:MAG: serpin family protein [Bacillota bacterium]
MNKRNTTYLCLAGILLAFFLATVIFSGGCDMFKTEKTLAAPAEEVDHRLSSANNRLGFDIFHQLKKEEAEENLFISPASILAALVMTYNGAEGETREAMEETLHFKDMSREEVNKAFADLLSILRNPDPKVEMTIANSLWAREGIDFKAAFLQRNEEYFDAEVAELNFTGPEAVNIINSWVDENTGGKIEDIIEPPINPLTVLFLINAIYFNGEWTEQFDPELTEEIPFNLPDGSEKEHPVMFQNSEFSYLETDLFQAVRLPYGDEGRIGMYVFLPEEEAGLEEFYSQLDAASWAEWTDSFVTREGKLGLPRFSFEYEATLNDILIDLGMAIAFDDSAADLSGMREIPPRLYISEVKHKSFIEVNEEGTEAAAATSVEVTLESAKPDKFTMIADRPFFFTIADDMTGSILFMGSLLEP